MYATVQAWRECLEVSTVAMVINIQICKKGRHFIHFCLLTKKKTILLIVCHYLPLNTVTLAQWHATGLCEYCQASARRAKETGITNLQGVWQISRNDESNSLAIADVSVTCMLIKYSTQLQFLSHFFKLTGTLNCSPTAMASSNLVNFCSSKWSALKSALFYSREVITFHIQPTLSSIFKIKRHPWLCIQSCQSLWDRHKLQSEVGPHALQW